MSAMKLVPCKIERSAFSSERMFSIMLSGEEPSLIGAAYYKHLRDPRRRQLTPDQPKPGHPIHGFVECLVLREEGDQYLVEVPSADILRIPANLIDSEN